MKTTIFAASAAIALLAASPAAAQDWYAQINAGVTFEGEADTDGIVHLADSDAITPVCPCDYRFSGNVDLDEGFAVGAAAGVALGNGVRVEGEFLYTTSDLGGIDRLEIDNVEFNHAAFFVNVLYDIPMQGGFNPYVGAGIGHGSSTFDIDGDSVHDEGTAWQVKAGVTYPVNDTLILDVGYRYVDMAEWQGEIEGVVVDDVEGGPGTASIQFEPSAHMLTVGARFKLGGG